MKRFLISLLLTLALCATVLLPVSASQDGYVYDIRGVFSEVNSMDVEADTIRQVTGIAPYFIITEDQGGLECEEYVLQFAEQHDFYDDAIVLLDGETSYYIIALGAANDCVTQEDLVAMRDAYEESETYSGGVRDYFNLLFTMIGTQIPYETQAPEETRALSETEAPVGIAIADAAQPSFRLVDEGGLLSPEERLQVSEVLDRVSEQYDMDVVVVTESTLGGKDKVAFADDFFDYGGYSTDGILLLFCPNEGVRYISTAGKAIDWYDGNNFSTLTGEIIPYFDSGDYAGAFLKYAQTCGEIAEQELYEAEKSPVSLGLVLFSLIAGAGLSFLIPMNMLKGELKSVRSKAAASDYVRAGSMQLTQDKDVFLYHTVARTERPKSTSSGGTHTGSSGSSHGGGSF